MLGFLVSEFFISNCRLYLIHGLVYVAYILLIYQLYGSKKEHSPVELQPLTQSWLHSRMTDLKPNQLPLRLRRVRPNPKANQQPLRLRRMRPDPKPNQLTNLVRNSLGLIQLISEVHHLLDILQHELYAMRSMHCPEHFLVSFFQQLTKSFSPASRKSCNDLYHIVCSNLFNHLIKK